MISMPLLFFDRSDGCACAVCGSSGAGAAAGVQRCAVCVWQWQVVQCSAAAEAVCAVCGADSVVCVRCGA